VVCKIGNGETAFCWSHRWAENSILQGRFRRFYSIKENKQATVSETRERIGDMWNWLLELEYVMEGTVVQAGMTDNWEGIHHT